MPLGGRTMGYLDFYDLIFNCFHIEYSIQLENFFKRNATHLDFFFSCERSQNKGPFLMPDFLYYLSVHLMLVVVVAPGMLSVFLLFMEVGTTGRKGQ